MFLNFPYRSGYTKLYLALIAATTATGLFPRAALEVTGGSQRLHKIISLLLSCPYSIHDISGAAPRPNVAMELGMATMWGTLSQSSAIETSHNWFVFATDRDRIAQTVSDVGGIDIHIHDGTPQGVFRELGNAFVGSDRSVEHMNLLFHALKTALPGIMRKRGAKSAFTASVFSDLRVLAADLTLRIPP